jgi:hypothetical protein
MSSMAFTVEDLTLEVFANTRSQTTAPKDTLGGASSNLDPQPTSSSTGAIHFGRNGANDVYGLSFEGGSFFK